MVNYAWSKRLRLKQYKRRHKPRRTLGKVNAGIRIRNDNMVEMKRLHRGKASMKYNYGNPPENYLSGFLRGTKNTSYKSEAKYKKSKKQKFVKNSLRSEL